MAPQLVATALNHWLDPDKGGRKALPSGSIYAATGRFAEREDELFSVVLRFPLKKLHGDNYILAHWNSCIRCR